MTQFYHEHEAVYRRMAAEGVRAWDQTQRGAAARPEIDPDTQRFLEDVLAQPWVARGGRALELGCGTGPMLRWLAERGFRGVGLDVSRTAVRMAREQSAGRPVVFRVADVCGDLPPRLGRFDLVVDGHCLHCVTEPEDRRALLANARALLRDDGVLIVQTMCGPVDRRAFRARFPRQHRRGDVIYVPHPRAAEFRGARTFARQVHAPVRCVPHWRRVLRELSAAGFAPRLVRLAAATGEEPTGDLSVAATVRPGR